MNKLSILDLMTLQMQSLRPAAASARSRRLTEEEKAAIVESMDDELATVAQVAREHDVCRATVERVWRAHRLRSDPEALAREEQAKAARKASRRTRRPATAEEEQRFFGVMRNNPGIPLKRAIEVSGYPGTEATARKRLKEARVKYVTPQAQRAQQTKQDVKLHLMCAWAGQPDKLQQLKDL